MQKPPVTENNSITIAHPSPTELPFVVALLNEAGLDMRLLKRVADEAYPSLGEAAVMQSWQTAYFTADVEQACRNQGNDILRFRSIPPAGTMIQDPFNMRIIERKNSVFEMVSAQAQNMWILKRNDEIVSTARVLTVGDIREIVSIYTKEKYRNLGYATKIISKMLSTMSERPLYSFQHPFLIPFYMRVYAQAKPRIPLFSSLPEALQRDLFYMNVFWSPYVVLELSE